jgi:hypothetical protein
MQKWEYTILVNLGRQPGGRGFDLTQELNRLGDEGSELVCCTAETEKLHPMLFLKRPKLVTSSVSG